MGFLYIYRYICHIKNQLNIQGAPPAIVISGELFRPYKWPELNGQLTRDVTLEACRVPLIFQNAKLNLAGYEKKNSRKTQSARKSLLHICKQSHPRKLTAGFKKMMGLEKGGFRLKLWQFLVSMLDFWRKTCWISIFGIFFLLHSTKKAQWLQHFSRSLGDLYPWGLENPDFANDRAWK